MSDAWLSSYVRTFSANCPVCRMALAEDRSDCPRCRFELRLGLKVREVYLAAWGVSLGGALVVAGFGLFILLIMALRGDPPVHLPYGMAVIWFICVLGILAVP